MSLPSLAFASETEASAPLFETSDGPVNLSVRLDKTTARVADPINLVLEVDAPKGARVELPAKAEQLGEFEIRRSAQTTDIPSAHHANERSWILRLTLESIKTGALAVPPMEIHYTTDAASTELKSLSTKPIAVHITSVLEHRPDPTKFRDIKQTVDIPVPAETSRTWIVWAYGAAAGAVVLALTFLVVRRRPRGLAPAAWALASIEELERVDVKQTAGADALFNEIVDVVREYIELEFQVPALERTTREFLAEAAEEVALPEVASKRLAWLASVADEIKFARLGVGEEHLQHAFAQAKAFIHECEAHRSTTMKGAA
jgi:hypothetical protein